MKSVFCIIVTYNGMAWIRKCLDSLLQSDHPVQIIVVDNHSTDDTAGFIRKTYPTVHLHLSKENLGFGQGNNLGIKLARLEAADFVFLLNQDAWVEKSTISRLVSTAVQHPEFGILSPLHINGTGTGFEQHFSNYLTRSDVHQLLWSALVLQERNENIIATPFVNAAAWLINSSCLSKTGGFDPIFYHYGEDDHYAQRARYHGFKLGIVPASKIFHDKETPGLVQAENLNRGINKDWIFFLTHVCNINLPVYKSVMIKRGIRHSLQWFGSLFGSDRYRRKYNFTLARNIFTYLPKVKKSRQICTKDNSPYL